jgi:hypothetical protein
MLIADSNNDTLHIRERFGILFLVFLGAAVKLNNISWNQACLQD